MSLHQELQPPSVSTDLTKTFDGDDDEDNNDHVGSPQRLGRLPPRRPGRQQKQTTAAASSTNTAAPVSTPVKAAKQHRATRPSCSKHSRSGISQGLSTASSAVETLNPKSYNATNPLVYTLNSMSHINPFKPHQKSYTPRFFFHPGLRGEGRLLKRVQSQGQGRFWIRVLAS